jgi:peroxiredoxin Q/BCP
MNKTSIVLPLLVASLGLAGCGKDKAKDKPATPAAGSAAAGSAAASAKPDTQPASAAAAEAKLLDVGAPAPDFTAEAHDGKTIAMKDLRGKPVVVYFYPKDETPGCTIEAHEFRDELPDITTAGATVIGISMDSLASHREFATNHQLNFPLLADEQGELAAKFGVPTTSGYAQRVTFVIGPDGKIARVFPQVSVKGHAEEVVAVVQSLAPAGQPGPPQPFSRSNSFMNATRAFTPSGGKAL